MIISPPFIPSPVASESDENFIDRAMLDGVPGDGAYPLSFDLNWHGGMHLSAPQEYDHVLPIRAIADGALVYFRIPTAKTEAPTHPLNYGDGWTDNGCIVLRHETEIGEGESGRVVFFSIYMHLSRINIANPQINQRIYRKDNIGEAGQIYGSSGKMHFEIIADQSQIEHLTGRVTRDLEYRTRDGRTDSCWGDLYFYIPNTVEGFDTPPPNFTQPGHPGTPVYRCPSLPEGWYTPTGGLGTIAFLTTEIDGYHPTVVKQLQEGLIVRMHYEKGQCQLTTCFVTGEAIGTQDEEADFEYNLYTTATLRYPACPSAGHELLRFGRVLGQDALQPANAAHWRKIRLPPRTEANESARSLWFNLNAPGITRFSDADFPHWLGWRLIDDDNDSDSHCQSEYIRDLLQPKSNFTGPQPRHPDAVSIAISPQYDALSEGDRRRLSEQYITEREVNTSRLIDAQAQGTLKRLICKFPTEWSVEDFIARYGWLKRVADGGPMPEDEFERLQEHQKALAFWEDANLVGIDSRHWHFAPREFIKLFSKCSWLKTEEMAQCFPRKILHLQGDTFLVNITSWSVALSRSVLWCQQINISMRKYGLHTRARILHFLSHVIPETGNLKFVKEINGESKSYSPYYGRGLIQITHLDNYSKYGRFRKFSSPAPLGQYTALGWNPDVLIARNNEGDHDYRNCADSAAFYFFMRRDMLLHVDSGIEQENSITVSKDVNGYVSIENLNGLDVRLQSVLYLKRILTNLVFNSPVQRLEFNWSRNSSKEFVYDAVGNLIMEGTPPHPKKKFYLSHHSIDSPLDHQIPSE